MRKYIFSYRKRTAMLITEFKAAAGCIDCGEKDPVVLDFDHPNNDGKGKSISRMVTSRSWESILAEIKKCEVRCSNCHRRVTAKRRTDLWGTEDRGRRILEEE